MGTKPDTKEKIIQKSRELFADRGYSATTTAEIARRVGVSEAALYKHFKSKKEMFLACITPNIFPKVEMNSDNPVRDIIQAKVELVRSNMDSFNILFRESLSHPELAQMFLEQVYTKDRYMERLLKKISKEDMSPVQSLIYDLGITSAIWSILSYDKIQEQFTSKKLPMGNMAEEITDVVLYGLLGKKQNQ